MNRALIVVDGPEPVSHDSPQAAILAAKSLNASPRWRDTRSLFASLALTGFRWYGSRCELRFEERTICLRANDLGLMLEASDHNAHETAEDDFSTCLFKLEFAKINLQVDWCPQTELSPCLGRQLIRLEKSDFGYLVEFQGCKPLLFSKLQVVKASPSLPNRLVYIAPFE